MVEQHEWLNWFNETHHLNLSKQDLGQSPRRGNKRSTSPVQRPAINEQTDGVAMASPLGPLLANAFVCS